jgi:hypothetical protein
MPRSPPGMRRLLCWVGRPAAAEKVAGAPPVAGASRTLRRGTFLENLGEVAGLQRASLWGYQEGQMDQNLPLCAQLGAARSHQDESNEVHEAGRIRRSSRGKEGHGHVLCPFAAPPDIYGGRWLSASGSELPLSLEISTQKTAETTAAPCWDASGRLLCSALSCGIQLACANTARQPLREWRFE